MEPDADAGRGSKWGERLPFDKVKLLRFWCHFWKKLVALQAWCQAPAGGGERAQCGGVRDPREARPLTCWEALNKALSLSGLQNWSFRSELWGSRCPEAQEGSNPCRHCQSPRCMVLELARGRQGAGDHPSTVSLFHGSTLSLPRLLLLGTLGFWMQVRSLSE